MQLSNVQPVLAEITRRSSRVALADYPSLLREGVLYNPWFGMLTIRKAVDGRIAMAPDVQQREWHGSFGSPMSVTLPGYCVMVCTVKIPAEMIQITSASEIRT